MLQTIREHTQGWIAGTIVTVLILSFAFWGVHSYFEMNSNSAVVAKVNGVAIEKEQLAFTYDRLQRQVGESNKLDPAQQAQLKERALRMLLELEILKQGALDQGLLIFNRQVDNYLQSMPEFQINGQFSTERFQQLLSSAVISISEFLDLVRTNLLVEQPRLGLIFSSFALPDESMRAMSLVNQVRDLQYMILPLVLDAKVPLAKIKAYYDQHQNDFKIPEQLRVEYIELSLEEKDMNRREQLANLSYEHPESLAIAAKTLNLPIKISEPFSKEKAKENDISNFKKIREVAFSNEVLASKNNSDLILLPQKAVVIRVKSHTESQRIPLEQLKPQIEAKLKLMQAEEFAHQLAKNLKEKLEAGENPEKLAATHHLSWKQTGFIGRYVTKIDAVILETGFGLPHFINKISYEIAKLPNGSYVIIGLKNIKNGDTTDKKQYSVFAEQVQNSTGLLEYELYKQSLFEKAKIKIEN